MLLTAAPPHTVLRVSEQRPHQQTNLKKRDQKVDLWITPIDPACGRQSYTLLFTLRACCAAEAYNITHSTATCEKTRLSSTRLVSVRETAAVLIIPTPLVTQFHLPVLPRTVAQFMTVPQSLVWPSLAGWAMASVWWCSDVTTFSSDETSER